MDETRLKGEIVSQSGITLTLPMSPTVSPDFGMHFKGTAFLLRLKSKKIKQVNLKQESLK